MKCIAKFSFQTLVCEHEIRNIHCACQDAEDLSHFAYITKDLETKGHYCHVFRVQTRVSVAAQCDVVVLVEYVTHYYSGWYFIKHLRKMDNKWP